MNSRSGAPQGYAIAVIGCSWGGLNAMRALLSNLADGFELPMAVVQHRHRNSDALLAHFLQDHSPLRVCEIEDKQPIELGQVFVAPPQYHLLVEHGHFSLSTEAPVRYSRPSIDVALTSAADAYGHRAVGIVLTGSNEDGAEGLRRIADAGGLAVVQDPESAESAPMPRAALRAVPTARVFELARMSAFLSALPVLKPQGVE